MWAPGEGGPRSGVAERVLWAKRAQEQGHTTPARRRCGVPRRPPPRPVGTSPGSGLAAAVSGAPRPPGQGRVSAPCSLHSAGCGTEQPGGACERGAGAGGQEAAAFSFSWGPGPVQPCPDAQPCRPEGQLVHNAFKGPRRGAGSRDTQHTRRILLVPFLA